MHFHAGPELLTATKYNENYKLEEVSTPKPQGKEVLIKITAASFCHTDYQVYQGFYGTQLPVTGCHEPVGTLASLGPDVASDWKLGDRVGAYLMRGACGSCPDCKWYASEHDGELHARYCQNRIIGGVTKADGGFADYMLTTDDAIVRIPEGVPWEQAAPLMCAGATVWSAFVATRAKKGSSMAVVGTGGLGSLGIQFAKALGYRVVSIGSRENPSNLDIIPKDLRADLYVNRTSKDAEQKLLDFTKGLGLDAAVITTDNVAVNDWTLHQLHPHGTAVVLGLPEEGYKFDCYNLVFRQINVKGSLHATREEMEEMLRVVDKYQIKSDVSLRKMEESEALPEMTHKREIPGKAVIIM
jgi:propanol-preferring alcohol dehydrogenase